MSRILNCTKLTITSLIQRFGVTGRTADRTRSGRLRVTTANEDCHLRILHLRNTFLTVTSSAATGLGHVISRHTVRHPLQQHGFRAYRPFRGMALRRQHRLWRLRWARQFQRWQHRSWHRYINQVLRPVLLPFLQRQPRLLFQQDNTRPHTARVVQQFLADRTLKLCGIILASEFDVVLILQ